MIVNYFNPRRCCTFRQTIFGICLIIINVYMIMLVARQAKSDYLYSKVAHKGFPGLIEKLFSASNSYTLQEKINMLKLASQLNPDHPQYYGELGKLYFELGKELKHKSISDQLSFYELAIENFRKSITINPIDPITQLNLTSARFQVSKNLNELLEAVEKIKQIDPHNKVLAKLL